MGCDIKTVAERKRADGGYIGLALAGLLNRNYSIFAFLAGIRNYSAITPIAVPRDLPEDASECVLEEIDGMGYDAHGRSWLSLAELRAFDYDQPIEDRRRNGGTLPSGEGVRTTYRHYLGEQFFRALDQLEAFGTDRLVFWFYD